MNDAFDKLSDDDISDAVKKIAAVRRIAEVTELPPEMLAAVDELSTAIEARDTAAIRAALQKFADIQAGVVGTLERHGAQIPMPPAVAQILQVVALNYRPHELLNALASVYEAAAQHYTEAHGEDEALSEKGKAYLSCAEGLRGLVDLSNGEAFDEVIYPK